MLVLVLKASSVRRASLCAQGEQHCAGPQQRSLNRDSDACLELTVMLALFGPSTEERVGWHLVSWSW